MFLKEVYRHSKWMFVGMLLFVCLQLAVNFKRGMVFSPFFHYGMYSFPQAPRLQYDLNIIQVGADTLAGKDFSPYQWDKLFFTLEKVQASGCDSVFYVNQICRLYNKAGLNGPSEINFINRGSRDEKLLEYKKWLSRQFNYPVDSIKISRMPYRYLYKSFIPLPMVKTQPQNGYLCN